MTKAAAIPEQYRSDWLQSLDGRLGVAKEMRTRYQAFTDDLGGAASLSYAQRSLVERALWLEFWLAKQEQTLATGGDFDVARWTQAANSLQGILAKLGLERKTKDVPDLASYLKAKQEAAQ